MHPTTPLRRSFARGIALLAVLAVLAAGCSDDSGDDVSPETSEAAETTTTTEPGTTAPIPESGEELIDLQINFVEFGDAGFVQIVNNGGSDADLNGIFSCQFPTYTDLGTVVDGGVIAAGGTVQIPAAIMGGLDAASGEAALYQGNNFGSPDSILSYVQWGTGGHERSSVAVGADLWPSVDETVTPDPAFNSIELFGDPVDTENWS